MDSQDVIIVRALEAVVESRRHETMQMKELLSAGEIALQEKAKECEMLKIQNLSLLAMEADKVKVIDDFMVFIEAIEKKEMKNAQNFDEKAMMNTILTMMNGGGAHSGQSGGFAADVGKC